MRNTARVVLGRFEEGSFVASLRNNKEKKKTKQNKTKLGKQNIKGCSATRLLLKIKENSFTINLVVCDIPVNYVRPQNSRIVCSHVKH